MQTSPEVLTPEEEELRLKEEELLGLEQELTEKELQLSTLKAELHTFEQRYHKEVGQKYAEWDEIKAKILELSARLSPENEDLKEDADAAWEQARQSAEETRESAAEPARQKKFVPSDALKKMFRKAAKIIHPDLTTDKKERKRRHDLMTRLNQAYDNLDEEKIRGVLREWEENPHEEQEEKPGTRLVKAIRQIAQVKRRLELIQREFDQTRNSEMYKLKERIDQAAKNGRDLLKEMIEEIEEQIDRLKSRMNRITQGLTLK